MRHPSPHAWRDGRDDGAGPLSVCVVRYGEAAAGRELERHARSFAAFIDRAARIEFGDGLRVDTTIQRTTADTFRLTATTSADAWMAMCRAGHVDAADVDAMLAAVEGAIGTRIRSLLAALGWARGRAMPRCLQGEVWPLLGTRVPVVLSEALAAMLDDDELRLLLEDAITRPLRESRATSVSLHAQTGGPPIWLVERAEAEVYARVALRECLGGTRWKRGRGVIERFRNSLACHWRLRDETTHVLIDPRTLRAAQAAGIDLSRPREVNAVIGETCYRATDGRCLYSRVVAEIDHLTVGHRAGVSR